MPTDDDEARSVDGCIRHRQHVTQKALYVTASVRPFAKLHGGTGTRRPRYFR
jgi:hypothetical protein